MTHFSSIRSLLAAAAFVALAASAQAGTAVDAATRAEALVGEGKLAEAMLAIEEAKAAIWDSAPLSFGKTVFVASDPQGYGIYDIRDGSTFKRTEPLVIYFEPLGYGYGKDGEINLIDLKLDFEITTPDGSSIAKQEGFANLALRSRFPNKEFMGKLTYDFSGVPAGDYIVTTTVHDTKSPKVGAFSLPFKLVD